MPSGRAATGRLRHVLDYAAARLLRHLGNRCDQQAVAIARKHGTIPEETPFTGTCGYGICPNNLLYKDIQFLYAIGQNRIVKIYRHLFPLEDDRRDFARLGKINLRSKTVYTPRTASFLGERFDHKTFDSA